MGWARVGCASPDPDGLQFPLQSGQQAGGDRMPADVEPGLDCGADPAMPDWRRQCQPVLRDRARDRDRDAVEPTLESPLVILDRRLVSGEIDIDEYVQLRRAITSGH